jgi:hypothetical protein
MNNFLETLPILTVILLLFSLTRFINIDYTIKYNIILSWFILQIVIVFYYRDNYVLFYSNDHLVYVDWVKRGKTLLINNEFTIVPRIIISYIGGGLLLLGISPSTFLKTINILAYIFVLSSAKRIIMKERLQSRFWRKYWFLVSGHSVFLFSLVGNRDVILCAFIILIYELLKNGKPIKAILFSIVLADFRTHLGAACIVGITFYLLNIYKFNKIIITCVIVICLISGILIYSIIVDLPFMVTSTAFSGYILFMSGLSFLSAPEHHRQIGLWELFAYRIIFFDSIIIPFIYVYSITKIFFSKLKYNKETVFLLTTTAFFFGASVQSGFYSFRQMIQFVPVFGVAAIINLESIARNKIRTKI